MKESLFLSFVGLIALSLGVLVCCTEKESGGVNNSNGDSNGDEPTSPYVDLGLSSGIKWKISNEENAADTVYNFFSLEEIETQFGDQIPSREQFEELIAECQWVWVDSGYSVTGPNGNTITFPAAGVRDRYGNEGGVGSVGRYWTSTPSGSGRTWKLDFNSDSVHMAGNYRCLGNSVRLIQD